MSFLFVSFAFFSHVLYLFSGILVCEASFLLAFPVFVESVYIEFTSFYPKFFNPFFIVVFFHLVSLYLFFYILFSILSKHIFSIDLNYLFMFLFVRKI